MFEPFRRVCLDNYGLDPSHFYTAMGLAWKACLKKTGVRLELVKDPDMLLMFEDGIRGGITKSVHRWAAANNPYMGYEYDTSKPSEYLQYLDANNLYGWAMSQPLPTGEFKWVEVKNDWSPKDVINSLVNTDRGYLLEVDVNHRKELHDYHNDLPFMCEKIKINGVEKLVPNLYDKKKYVIHIKALQQALSHGLVLEKIHRIIDRPLPVGKNKKVIGLMKDELGRKIMKEFISLRPKMYSYRVEELEPKKCKGIKKCIVKKTISFEDYKRCLFEGTRIHGSQILFRSVKHKVRTLEVNKLALSREDEKRIRIDGISSYAMGHYNLN